MANKGFTLIELMVVIAILGILAGFAGLGFSSIVNQERLGSATDGFVRMLEQTKAHAIQTGKRTQLLINASTLANCGDQNVSWAIVEEGNTTTAVSCLTKVDFTKRFGGVTLSPSTASTLTMNPLGIANNDSKLTYTLNSSEKNRKVDVYPGGGFKLL